ncbi:NADP-dependent oxidoreductase [Chryseobacterium sp. NKUCC03_KSP]|jgi:alcohol dehydrogenase|uniref:NADP-dependent oxidoreductase n=1 Tax=Chryseobacterium sp. NKUCC03_KSP TaxID=2842125 RepID=UPI000FAF67C0|nr:NADP-dependent oxidoreductase [Chryseobacterium sp. NKUCC03_KSP]MBW3523532.1 NADP-dependent oxidoreductase [Chryseobacterium sp. NKUCC03_KSP]
MKAFSISRYKKNSELKLADMPEPIVREDEVLVEIYAASVNLLDSKIKSGEFKLILPYKMPLILGHDVAGVIIKVGSRVKNFKVGDEIYARPSDFHIGTFAEFISINEKDVALKPNNLTMEEAASIPLVGLTAWQALVEKSKVQKGQKVFIQAGSGGVGTFAIQLAKHLGATVATTASEKSFDFLKNLGADVLIDYKKQNFEDVLIDYDVVLNSQDSKTLEKSFEIVKSQGKIISISGPPTPVFAEEFNLPWYVKFVTKLLSSKVRKIAKKQNVNYSFLFMKANGKQLAEITKVIESGIIKPVIDKVFPFQNTNEAVKYVESGRAKGKVVIKMK